MTHLSHCFSHIYTMQTFALKANNLKSFIRTLNLFCSTVEQMCSRFIEGVAGYNQMNG